jgi:hypothetical protein
MSKNKEEKKMKETKITLQETKVETVKMHLVGDEDLVLCGKARSYELPDLNRHKAHAPNMRCYVWPHILPVQSWISRNDDSLPHEVCRTRYHIALYTAHQKLRSICYFP